MIGARPRVPESRAHTLDDGRRQGGRKVSIIGITIIMKPTPQTARINLGSKISIAFQLAPPGHDDRVIGFKTPYAAYCAVLHVRCMYSVLHVFWTPESTPDPSPPALPEYMTRRFGFMFLRAPPFRNPVVGTWMAVGIMGQR
jgi:hypothetical protein